ncbi:MAG: 2-isopropylmalate synthase, partial [Clostridia bacterium]|nr:2-isopropylmalate synthase [Clostridia bacterium]
EEDDGKIYEEFKRVIAKKETIGARELEAIIASSAMQVPSTFHVVNYVVNSGNIITATANLTLEKDGEQLHGVSTGDGPIDAAFHAIEQIVGHHYELDDFQVHAVTKGREAVGSALIRLRANGKLYSGNGVSTDIIGACIRAYVNALNKIVYEG